MLEKALQRLGWGGEVVRGAPHFVVPPRAPDGVVAWIAEGWRVPGTRRVVLTAIIELHAGGVRRRTRPRLALALALVRARRQRRSKGAV